MRYCLEINAVVSRESKLLGTLTANGYLYLFKENKLLSSIEKIYAGRRFSYNETLINSLLTGILL